MKIKNLIEKVKRTVAGFMATIICLALLPAINVKAEISSNIFTYGNYDIEYNIVNEWDGYQNIEIKLTNIGSDPIYNWALGYNAGGEITNTWNCTVYSSNGTDYIIKNSGYNYEVMPEASITFGYTLMGSNLTIPSAFENCAERIEISDKYDAQLIITDKWDIVASWSDSSSRNSLNMSNSKDNVGSGTFRVRTVFTVYSGSSSEVVEKISK